MAYIINPQMRGEIVQYDPETDKITHIGGMNVTFDVTCTIIGGTGTGTIHNNLTKYCF
jgi:hypothetical protein